jgi:hypothetical protein
MEQPRDALAPPIESDVPQVTATASPPEREMLPVAPVTPFWRKILGQPGIPLPLFHRTKTNKDGVTEEIMWGPAAVHAIRWIVTLVLGALLIWKAGNTAGAMDMVLKWLAGLR